MNAHKLKVKRVDTGYTQQQAADFIGKSIGSYNKKEKGIVKFTDDEKAKLAELLEMTDEEYLDIFLDGQLPSGKKAV